MASVRWGIISTAKIAREHVVPAIQKAGNCEVVAIASREGSRGRSVAAELGIPKVYADYRALLADPAVDAVYVPLPNHLHAAWTVAAAEAGKHVLCEKPLGMDADQAAEMVSACDAAGVLLMEAFMYRFHPSWVAVRDLVTSGRIGELRAVQTWFSYFNVDPDNIRNVAGYGGGALMDIGCYPINVSRMLFGTEPTRIEAVARRDPVFGVDVVTSAVLEFPGGGQSAFTCSTQVEADQRVDIYGSEGRITVEIPFNIPPDQPVRVILTAGGDPPVAPASETLTFGPSDQYTLQAEAFAEAVLSGGSVPTPPRDAVANMKVIEDVFAAAGRA
jgi:predicted dehydrogenase